MTPLVALIFSGFIANNASASENEECIFDVKGLTPSFSSADFSSYHQGVTDVNTRYAYGLWKDGYVFSFKSWACDHAVRIASLMIGPNIDTPQENLSADIIRFSQLLIGEQEAGFIKDRLIETPATLSSLPLHLEIENSGLDQLSVTVDVVGNSLYIEIMTSQN